ncbi:MAG: SDR family NAD(P)-dependent oxidoreductase [Clostridia bacterium]|nr:SDR family NAD(P)-dependent oxidoreductase [Clostridia bacterium]
MEFKDKVFVVTGGGNGIGREVILQLLNAGAKVSAVDINEENLKETLTLSKNDKKLSTHVLDITDRVAVDALPALVIKKHKQVDGLINVAGIVQPFLALNDLSIEQIEKVMNVNYYGTVNMIKAFLPYLLKRPDAYISNVSSMGGIVPFPGQAAYGASKAAVILFTESLYAELMGTNVNVNLVAPGAIATNILKNSNVEAPKMDSNKKMPITSAPDAAKQILEGIRKNKFRVTIGKDAKFLCFLYRISPRRAVRYLAKKMSSILKK